MTSAGGELSTIERAIQLARTSSCTSIDDIRKSLRREGYSGIDEHLAGSSIKKTLQEQMALRRRDAASA
jgi:hypothetical protein